MKDFEDNSSEPQIIDPSTGKPAIPADSTNVRSEFKVYERATLRWMRVYQSYQMGFPKSAAFGPL
jgi:hypothetical protein